MAAVMGEKIVSITTFDLQNPFKKHIFACLTRGQTIVRNEE